MLTTAKKSSVNSDFIILDTNAFIEGYRHPIEFKSILDMLTSGGCYLTSLEVIKLEFLSKSRSYEELQRKIDFYNNSLTYPELPYRTYEKETQELPFLFVYGLQCQNFKSIDFTIAAALKKYAYSAHLLTNDHGDFTTQLFDLKDIIPLEAKNGVIPFGLYEFSPQKYTAILEKYAKQK